MTIVNTYDSTIQVYLDLHAHATKRGCFIYGNHLDTLGDMTVPTTGSSSSNSKKVSTGEGTTAAQQQQQQQQQQQGQIDNQLLPLLMSINRYMIAIATSRSMSVC
jgi:hypothetical protein